MNIKLFCLHRNIFHLGAIFGCALLLSGCGLSTKKENGSISSVEVKDASEYSLAQDRADLEKLRADVPAVKRKQNDELMAIIQEMTSGRELHPSKLRDRFEKKVRRLRDIFGKDVRKERERYTKQERKKRADFLDQQKLARDEFNSKPHGKEERGWFYSSLDSKRKDFFSEERDERKDFESKQREKSDDFNAYIRESRRRFYEELAGYTKEFYQRKNMLEKAEKIERENRRRSAQQSASTFSVPATGGSGSSAPPGSPYDKDFEIIQSTPGQSLSPGDN